MRRVLVTGGNGLVGQALQALQHSGYIYTNSKESDLTDMTECQNLFEKYRPDMVIHLAVCVGGCFEI